MDYIDVTSPPTTHKKNHFVKICANSWLKINTLIRGDGFRGGEGRKKNRLGAWWLPSGCLFGLK